MEIRKTRGLSYTDANYLDHSQWEIIEVNTIGMIGYEITWRKKS